MWVARPVTLAEPVPRFRRLTGQAPCSGSAARHEAHDVKKTKGCMYSQAGIFTSRYFLRCQRSACMGWWYTCKCVCVCVKRQAAVPHSLNYQVENIHLRPASPDPKKMEKVKAGSVIIDGILGPFFLPPFHPNITPRVGGDQ